MTEIDKLFENAWIKKCNRMLPCPFENQCEDCEFNWYSDFTDEKQLELIKWLAIRLNSDYVAYWYNEIKETWIFRLNDLTELSSEEPCVEEGRNKNFADALCDLINHLWQSLTDKEKEEIRNILK